VETFPPAKTVAATRFSKGFDQDEILGLEFLHFLGEALQAELGFVSVSHRLCRPARDETAGSATNFRFSRKPCPLDGCPMLAEFRLYGLNTLGEAPPLVSC